MSASTEDVFLETVIAGVLGQADGKLDHAATARLIIEAIAGKSPAWQIVDPACTWLSVATPLGDYSASGPSCTHFYAHDGDAVAGDLGDNPDDTSYLHLCDLDDHIALLVGLREARRRFKAGEKLPVCQHDCVTRRFEGDVVVAAKCQCCGKVLVGGEESPASEPVPTAPALVPEVMEPVVFVPCPGSSCVSYLYGVDHRHVGRPTFTGILGFLADESGRQQ